MKTKFFASISIAVVLSILLCSCSVQTHTANNTILLPLQHGDNWGYVSTDGNFVIDPEFDMAYPFTENHLARVEKYGRTFYIDTSGNVAVDAKIQSGLDFYNGLAPACSNDKWGYIDENENFAITPIFDQAHPFDGTCALVCEGNLYGYINSSGDYISNERFSSAEPFGDKNFARVRSSNGLMGVIDRNCDYVIPPQFDYIYEFSENQIAAVKKGDLFGYVSLTGELITELEFSKAEPFSSNDIALVAHKYFYKFINSQGDFISDIRFIDADSFRSDKPAAFLIRTDDYGKSGKWGFISKSGQVVIPTGFDDATSFTANGLAAVCIDEKWGYIREDGTTAITPSFDYAYPFDDSGFAIVRNDEDKFGYIDQSGNYLVHPQFDSAEDFDENGIAEIVKDGKHGYLLTTGKIILAK